jgi:hypothetical protein
MIFQNDIRQLSDADDLLSQLAAGMSDCALDSVESDNATAAIMLNCIFILQETFMV